MNQPENTAPKEVESVKDAADRYYHSFDNVTLYECPTLHDCFKAGTDHAITVINNRIAELELEAELFEGTNAHFESGIQLRINDYKQTLKQLQG